MRFQTTRRRASCAAVMMAATATLALPAPVLAQGLLGRIKRVIEQVEQTSSEAEQVAGSAQRVLGPRQVRDRGRVQPAPPPQQGWDDAAQMGADYAPMGPDYTADTGDYGTMAAAGPSLILYTSTNFRGYSSVVTSDAPSLHTPEINQGDKTYSLIAQGPWELCKDTHYRGQCVVYEGEVASLDRLGGTFSSARYLGAGQ